MAPRRRYTKDQKARAVAAATLSSAEAASEALGIPRRTIGYWLDSEEFAELRHKGRDQVADQMWAAIQVGVEEVTRGLRDSETPLSAKSVALGILYDKHALLTGGATGRTESRDLTGTLADADIIDAVRTAEAIAAGGPDRGEAEDPQPPEG